MLSIAPGLPEIWKERIRAGARDIEVFEGEVMDCRRDLARLFESAARLVQADFSLDRDTNYGELAA